MKTLIALLLLTSAAYAAPNMDTSLDREMPRAGIPVVAPSKAPTAKDVAGVETATCRDGLTYYSATGEHRGACSGHGGVASWADGSPVKSKGGRKTSYR